MIDGSWAIYRGGGGGPGDLYKKRLRAMHRSSYPLQRSSSYGPRAGSAIGPDGSHLHLERQPDDGRLGRDGMKKVLHDCDPNRCPARGRMRIASQREPHEKRPAVCSRDLLRSPFDPFDVGPGWRVACCVLGVGARCWVAGLLGCWPAGLLACWCCWC